MGGTCMTAHCAGSYCLSRDDQYQGNIIFKSIRTKLLYEGENFSLEEKQILERCEALLKKAEEERENIAEKFADLLDNTGVGVLSKPTLERAIITYVIYLFEQIILSAISKRVDFDKNDFAITNFISVTKDKPFIAFNQDTLNNLKAKYGFDISNVSILGKGKRTIINFLSAVMDTKVVIEKQYETLQELISDFRNNSRMVAKLKDSMEGLKFIINYFSELTSSLYFAQTQLADPKKIELFYKIAQSAAEKGIRDPKEFVLIYSQGDNCGNAMNWEENIVYKKVEILKY